MKKWKYSSWGLFGVIAVILFVYMQKEYAYHFYFVEQNYMFQSSWPYIAAKCAFPGCLAEITGEFLIQYFMYPFIGAAITVGLLTLIAYVTTRILSRIKANDSWSVLSWIPACCLLFVHSISTICWRESCLIYLCYCSYGGLYRSETTVSVCFMLC
jgi:hypothetical protein